MLLKCSRGQLPCLAVTGPGIYYYIHPALYVVQITADNICTAAYCCSSKLPDYPCLSLGLPVLLY